MKKRVKTRALALLCVMGLVVSSYGGVIVRAAAKPKLSTKKITLKKGKSKVLKVKNTKKKVKWKVLSGKKIIKLKKKGKTAAKITGKKKGTAKVQAVVGKKKLTCKVKVKGAAKKTSETSATSVPAGAPTAAAGTQPTASVSTQPTTSVSTQPTTSVSTQPAVTVVTTTVPQLESQTTTPQFVTGTPEPTAVAESQATPTATPMENSNITGDEENDYAEYNQQDVAALKKLIAEQRKLGANVSEDLDSYEYEWDEDTGRLVSIYWGYEEDSDDEYTDEEDGDEDWEDDEEGDVDSETSVSSLKTLILTQIQQWIDTVSGVVDEESENADSEEDADTEEDVDAEDESDTEDDEDYTQDSQEYNLQGNISFEDFDALEGLDCYGSSSLTGLDVSKNEKLEYLDCSNAALTSLDVSNNVNLIDLNCSYNQLTSLNVSNNVSLETLSCDGNGLTSLDVSKNINLESLDCTGNQLTSLDVSNLTSLKSLSCDKGVEVIGCSEDIVDFYGEDENDDNSSITDTDSNQKEE